MNGTIDSPLELLVFTAELWIMMKVYVWWNRRQFCKQYPSERCWS